MNMKKSIKYSISRRFINIIWGTAVASLIQIVGMASAQAQTAQAASKLKDLDIRQIPMAQIALPTPSAASSNQTASSNQLEVIASVDREDHTYGHGEKVKITVETNKDSYVWIFDTGTSGKVHQIFPNKHATDNFVRADSPITIPSDNTYNFVVSHPQGRELLTVLASAEDVPLTKRMKLVPETGGAFPVLHGTAAAVAKDISVAFSDQNVSQIAQDIQVLHIK
jgi:hypothetical protein